MRDIKLRRRRFALSDGSVVMRVRKINHKITITNFSAIMRLRASVATLCTPYFKNLYNIVPKIGKVGLISTVKPIYDHNNLTKNLQRKFL